MKLSENIIKDWFARLPKGYAVPKYSDEELKVLKEVFIENRIDIPFEKLLELNEQEPEQQPQPQQPTHTGQPDQRNQPSTRFRGKTADFMESPEAFSSFIISRYTDGVVKIQGFEKLHQSIRGLSDSRLQAVTKIIYENTNRQLINGTFRMGDNERLLLKLLINSLQIEHSNAFNLFLAIIYDGKINAHDDPTQLQTTFTVSDHLNVASHTNFGSQTITMGVVTPDLKNKLDTLSSIYKLIKDRDIDSSYPVSEINTVLQDLNNPNVQQEIEQLLHDARSSNIESKKALAKQIQDTLQSVSIDNLVGEFIRSVDSVIRLKLQHINYVVTVTNRMVYVKGVDKIYRKIQPGDSIPNTIMNFSNGHIRLSSKTFKDLILETKINTASILKNINKEEIIKEWFAKLPKGYAEPPYSDKEIEVLQGVLDENNIINEIVVNDYITESETEDHDVIIDELMFAGVPDDLIQSVFDNPYFKKADSIEEFSADVNSYFNAFREFYNYGSSSMGPGELIPFLSIKNARSGKSSEKDITVNGKVLEVKQLQPNNEFRSGTDGRISGTDFSKNYETFRESLIPLYEGSMKDKITEWDSEMQFGANMNRSPYTIGSRLLMYMEEKCKTFPFDDTNVNDKFEVISYKGKKYSVARGDTVMLQINDEGDLISDLKEVDEDVEALKNMLKHPWITGETSPIQDLNKIKENILKDIDFFLFYKKNKPDFIQVISSDEFDMIQVFRVSLSQLNLKYIH